MTRIDLERGRIVVGEEDAGRRLDHLLCTRLDAPKGLVAKLVRKGNVRVNRRRAKPSQRLHAGDEIFVPASLRRAPEAPAPPPDALLEKARALPVLAETPAWMALAKPPGWVVHGGSGHRWGLIEALRAARGEPELRLVHRLDRGTSGVLLVARGPAGMRRLADVFADRRMRKRYLAWTLGAPAAREGLVRSQLRKGAATPRGRGVAEDPRGKPAQTRWRLVLTKATGRGAASLLALAPDSGRTHQLRVHLASLGLPILGDPLYAPEEAHALWQALDPDGMALHAWELAFEDPFTGARVQLRAPFPDSWRRFARI